MKQEGVHRDANRVCASPCMVQTSNSSKKQQEAATLCSITSSTYCCCCSCIIRMMERMYDSYPCLEHVVRVQCVRKHEHLGNIKPFNIFGDIAVHDKRILATKIRRYRYFRCTGRFGASASPCSTPIRSYCSGQDRRKNYLLCTY